MGCAALSALLMALLLDNLRVPHGKKTSSLKLLTLSIRHFMNSGYQKLLVPVTIYRGYAQAFIVSDFTAVSIHSVIATLFRLFEPPHDKNQQNDCAQRRLRSA